jgi:hypothetical protein
LTDVGFAHAAGEELVLVVSHDGRGAFSTTGERIPIAGFWGGQLPDVSEDGWRLERVTVDGLERVVLHSPEPDAGDLARIADDRVVELRAAGFLPSGRTIVVATTADITFISRCTDRGEATHIAGLCRDGGASR